MAVSSNTPTTEEHARSVRDFLVAERGNDSLTDSRLLTVLTQALRAEREKALAECKCSKEVEHGSDD